MSKLERMKRQAEIAKKEHIQQTELKIKDAKMEFIDHELPPDEVDEKEVQRSLLTSIRTFIPYTNEWYEALAAEEEMDDLRKIKIEKVKASDLYTLTKIGRHEEALDQMMSETNNDFFYFNKLKYKLEQEGKWKFDFKKNSEAFGADQNVHRNRLRKAVNTIYGSLDENVTDELARLSNAEAKYTKRYDHSAPCNWRGKNKDGEAMRCENIRMERPPRSDQPPRKKNEPADILACCSYHTPHCISEVHEANADVKIKIPNSDALCAECYMMKRGKKPPPLTAIIVPGAVLTSMAKLSSPPVTAKSATYKGNVSGLDGTDAQSTSGESAYSAAKRKKNANKCTWQSSMDNPRTRGYECCNEKFIHPITKIKLSTCPWHLTQCIRDHPDGSNSVITIPNPLGLCSQHFLAETGQPAKQAVFPYPGMQVKLARDHWKGKRHFAVPKDEPPPVLVMKEYVEPEKPQDFVEKMVYMVKMAGFLRRKHLYGKQSALRIQAWYRGSRYRRLHIDIRYTRQKYKRLLAAVRIQSLARRYFSKCRVYNIRALYNSSALYIQRIRRGYTCRKLLLIDWAAKKIVKFMKLLHFFKFKDTVIMIMQLRRLYKKHIHITIYIQRIYRGYQARKYIFQVKLFNIIKNSYSKKIQKCYLLYVKRKNTIIWTPPGETYVIQNITKKIAYMLLYIYYNYKNRKNMKNLIKNSTPIIQKHIRGFLARSGCKKMKFLRLEMIKWLQPHLAKDYLQKYLNSCLFYNNNNSSNMSINMKQENNLHDHMYIRKYVHINEQNKYEISIKSFHSAIEQYYHSNNMILLQSEKMSILKKFRNPMNGNIRIKTLDQFIESHKFPCRKHGRFICGDCTFRRNCQIGSCKCVLFKSSTEDGHGICVHCDHPGSLHSLCPKQLRHITRASKRGPSMLSIVTAVREPDMSFPTGVEGLAAESVVVPKPTADDRREMRTKTLRKERKALEVSQLLAERSLAKSLSLLEMDGSRVHSQEKYWGVVPVSAVAPIEESAERNDTAIFDPVVHDHRAPNYKITPTEFWNMTSKNPNKTIRDYHEKFDHNMPVPVVKEDQIVYSFEGPQIYFNLLNQIIRIDEKVDEDNPEFLKLVVDHVQLFERHWRKMVADIRKGKLDRNLHISEESRLIFESANIPRPQLASRLDNTFRNLGFHMKVLGKDIEIRPYAKKKKIGVFAQPAPRRKRSLPTNALAAIIPPATTTTGITGVSKPLSSSTKLPAISNASFSDTDPDLRNGSLLEKTKARFALDDVATRRTGTVIRPNQLSSNPLLSAAATAVAAANASVTTTTDSSALTKFDPHSVPSRSATKRAVLEEMGQPSAAVQKKETVRRAELPSPTKKPQTKRELLASLGRTFQAVAAASEASNNRPASRAQSAALEDAAGGGSRPGTRDSTSTTPTRKRRGSHSDSQSRPITAHDLDAVHYSLDTAARDNYKHTIKTDGDRFVCPFPACGKSFHSMDAAFRHLPIHEQRTRLYAPTPLPDSHLGFYWPEGVPWLDNDRYAERAIPPGALACTVPGCKSVFSAQMHFEAHLRNVHGIVGNSSATHGFFVMKGEASYVPPDRPPPYVPLHWCPMHSLPLGSCSTCVRIDSSKGPKQPFRFYPAVEINFRLRRQLKLHVPNTVAHVESAADRQSAILEYSDAHIGVVVVHKTVKVAAGPAALESPSKLSRHNSILSTDHNAGGSSRSLTRLRRQVNSSHTAAAAHTSHHVAHEWRGRPVAMMTDRNDNGWVAVEVLYTHAEASQKGLSIPSEFNKRYQLLRPLRSYISIDPDGNVELAELEIYDTAAVDDFERYIRWVPIHTIDRTFSLTLCETQEEVEDILKNSPPTALKNKFFVSHSDVDY